MRQYLCICEHRQAFLPEFSKVRRNIQHRCFLRLRKDRRISVLFTTTVAVWIGSVFNLSKKYEAKVAEQSKEKEAQ